MLLGPLFMLLLGLLGLLLGLLGLLLGLLGLLLMLLGLLLGLLRLPESQKSRSTRFVGRYLENEDCEYLGIREDWKILVGNLIGSVPIKDAGCGYIEFG